MLGRALAFLFLALLPLGAQAPELVAQTGHVAEVKCLAFSPDSRRVATGGRDGDVILWDAASGREFRALRGHGGTVNAVAWGPGGIQLASAGADGTVRVWEAVTGKLLRTLRGAPIVDSLAWSPDGRILAAGGDDHLIRLWDPSGGGELGTLSGHRGDVTGLAFSPDGRTLASCSHDHDVRLWEIPGGRLLRVLQGHPVAVSAVAWSRDGLALASAGGGYAGNAVVLVWDPASGAVRRRFDTRDEWFSCLAFTPAGDELLGGTNTSGRAVHRFDVARGADLGTLPTRSGAVYGLAFSPDGQMCACGAGRAVSLREPGSWAELRTLDGTLDGVGFLATGGDGILAAGAEAEVWIWDLAKAAVVRRVAFGGSLSALASGGGLLAGAVPSGVELRDAKGALVRTLAAGSSPVRSLAFQPGGSLLAGGCEDGAILVWSTADGALHQALRGHMDFVHALAFSPDGRTLYSGSGDTMIKVWDLAAGREAGTLLGHTNWVEALAVSEDGRRLLSGGGDETVRIWNLDALRQERVLRGHSDRVTSVAFGPGGRTALSGCLDGTAILWDLETGAPRRLEARAGGVTAAAFAAGGRLVLAGTRDGVVRAWDAASGQEPAALLGFRDGEWIAATPGGPFEASSGGARHLGVRFGGEVYAIDQFFQRFYRPEQVRLAMAGQAAPEREALGAVLARGPAPGVRILEPLPGARVTGDSVLLRLAVTDRGGGIGDAFVYLNGAQVANDTRGLRLEGDPAARTLAFQVPLAPGENVLRAVVANRDGSMESAPASVTVACAGAAGKPDLYALVVGIDTYRNPSIRLAYAVSDATAFARALREVSAPLFSKADIQVLATPEATTREALVRAFDRLKAKVRPKDVFVFYDASHGLVDPEAAQYFLLTSNVLFLSSRHIAADALGQKELAALIGSVPAGKKMVVLDTCQAGMGGKEIGLALLQQTRGLDESTAVKLLQRATGSAVFSASLDAEQALEGYRGHGLFTYVLIEGLEGKARVRDRSYITVMELADYVEEEVVRISEDQFKRQQTPTIQATANFPIAGVK